MRVSRAFFPCAESLLSAETIPLYDKNKDQFPVNYVQATAKTIKKRTTLTAAGHTTIRNHEKQSKRLTDFVIGDERSVRDNQ